MRRRPAPPTDAEIAGDIAANRAGTVTERQRRRLLSAVRVLRVGTWGMVVLVPGGLAAELLFRSHPARRSVVAVSVGIALVTTLALALYFEVSVAASMRRALQDGAIAHFDGPAHWVSTGRRGTRTTLYVGSRRFTTTRGAHRIEDGVLCRAYVLAGRPGVLLSVEPLASVV